MIALVLAYPVAVLLPVTPVLLALLLLAGGVVGTRVTHVSLPLRLAVPRDGDSRRRGLLMEKPRSGLALGAAGLVQVADQRVELVSR
jgi:hypothetical protein